MQKSQFACVILVKSELKISAFLKLQTMPRGGSPTRKCCHTAPTPVYRTETLQRSGGDVCICVVEEVRFACLSKGVMRLSRRSRNMCLSATSL